MTNPYTTASLGTPATTAIICKGLGKGLPACYGLITSRFSLVCKIDILRHPSDAGGGPYPGPAWNKVDDIQNFFKPVTDVPGIPKGGAVRQKRKFKVTIEMSIGNYRTSTDFILTERPKNLVVKVFNLIESFGKKGSVTIKKISSLWNITVKKLKVVSRDK